MEQEESRALGEKLLAQALRAEGLQLPRPATMRPPAALWQQLIALERQPHAATTCSSTSASAARSPPSSPSGWRG